MSRYYKVTFRSEYGHEIVVTAYGNTKGVAERRGRRLLRTDHYVDPRDYRTVSIAFEPQREAPGDPPGDP